MLLLPLLLLLLLMMSVRMWPCAAAVSAAHDGHEVLLCPDELAHLPPCQPRPMTCALHAILPFCWLVPHCTVISEQPLEAGGSLPTRPTAGASNQLMQAIVALTDRDSAVQPDTATFILPTKPAMRDGAGCSAPHASHAGQAQTGCFGPEPRQSDMTGLESPRLKPPLGGTRMPCA